MTKEPKSDNKELAEQIKSAWSEAQKQLEKLRLTLEENEGLKKAKRQLDAAEQDREARLKALGEAVLGHFSAGGQVPAAFKAAYEAAKSAEVRLSQQKSSIADLLAEAEVAVKEKVVRRVLKK